MASRSFPPPRRDPWSSSRSVYIGLAAWMQLLGVLLILAPKSWYGASWSYFSELPHNGTGMGICCLAIGGAQLLAITNGYLRATSVLLFLGGFVFWTAGIILGAEGLLGHQGLMEAPFMMYVGAHKFTHSAALFAANRTARVKT